MANEKPRRDVFAAELFRLSKLLREGQINDKEFFDGIMSVGDGKPLFTMIRADNGYGNIEWYDIERIKSGIRVGQSDKSLILALIGLDKKGKLKVRTVRERWFPEPEDEPEWRFMLDEEKEEWGRVFLGALKNPIVAL